VSGEPVNGEPHRPVSASDTRSASPVLSQGLVGQLLTTVDLDLLHIWVLFDDLKQASRCDQSVVVLAFKRLWLAILFPHKGWVIQVRCADCQWPIAPIHSLLLL